MIRDYQKKDVFSLVAQKEQAKEAAEFAHFFEQIKAYTLCDNHEQILGVVGYQKIALRQAMCYALLGQNCRAGLFELVKFSKKEIALKMKEEKIEEVFMTLKKNFLPAQRLAKMLGFQLKAELPSFFNNEDYQLFERKK